MSEELLQISHSPIGRYLFYKIGASTLSQLKKQKIIKSKFSNDNSAKKPDGLIVLPGGDVKAVIEYKQPSELNTKAKIDKAIRQELDVARELCNLLIVTDGQKTFWINSFNGQEIINENGKKINFIFDAKEIVQKNFTQEKINDLESIIDKIDHSINANNNQISQPKVLDPSALAKTIWQKIWINTGKDPEKCLYNVVELFVFKFLSDVGVLKPHNNFQSVYQLVEKKEAVDALKHYANTCRKEIKTLFPKGEDGTTIINGTIFVNEQGSPNTSQSNLFSEVLADLQQYDSKFGSFKYIQKEFKTRLYESFLRQQAGIKSLGQYFTPRNVVRAMVEMSNASQLKAGARICDPFCGVGGFILEVIAGNQHIWQEFEPKNEKINPKITLIGYDKGSDEKEDERTIILAKANMLIYFSDLLVKHHSKTNLKSFSEDAFNKVFNLLRSNLGTFERINEEPFDLILTNPPYVTSGSSSLKKAIDDNGLTNYYKTSGRGTESLALEWIVKNLKEGGQSLVVVPDGLLNQANMLAFLKSTCVIEAIISLPSRTFYSTPKKTYILVLKKKRSPNDIQINPVFTYLVSEIGETRDTKRFPFEKNDLNEAVNLFNQYKGSPKHFSTTSPRCKIHGFQDFENKTNWMVDRWWTRDEQEKLGVLTEKIEMDEDSFVNIVEDVGNLILKFAKDFKVDLKNAF